jgi:hypothetical protein
MLSKEIAGIALVFGILVSCYVGMVEIVNIFALMDFAVMAFYLSMYLRSI